MRIFKKTLGFLSVSAVSAALIFTAAADSNAQWKKNDKGWWYEEADGSYPVKAWKYIGDKWYYFDDIGYMAESCWVGNYPRQPRRLEPPTSRQKRPAGALPREPNQHRRSRSGNACLHPPVRPKMPAIS